MKKTILFSVLKLIIKEKPIISISIIIAVSITAIFAPLYLILTKELFDYASKAISDLNNELSVLSLIFLLIKFFGVSFGEYLIMKINKGLLDMLDIEMKNILQNKLMNKVNELNYDKFDESDFYDSIKIAMDEIQSGSIVKSFSSILYIFMNIITLIAVSIILLKFSILAIIVSIICCLPGFLHQDWYSKENWDFIMSKVSITRKLDYLFFITTSKKTFKENKEYKSFNYFIHKYDALYCQYLTDIIKFNKKNLFLGSSYSLIHAIGTIIIICWIYLISAKGEVTIGEAVMYVAATQKLYNIIQNLIHWFGDASNNIKKANGVISFLKIKAEGRIYSSMQHINHIESIEFINVTFRYPNTEKYVIKNMSFNIKKGEKIAIVGENGAGKSTLFKLLVGLYHTNEGEILINGINVNNINNECIYKNIAVCFQELNAYSFSIRENIGFGNISSINNDIEILEAAEKSGFDSVIEKGEISINHFINRDFSNSGIVLSEGEKQRLALARAFMHKGSVIILDEPSACLDIKTENEIFEKTFNLVKEKTVIFITHRLSNIIFADKIIFIKNGEIKGKGRHVELLNSSIEYSELYNMQAGSFID